MRTWTYSYKTSDGLRHEGEIDALTKDGAYLALRRKGIRAIRVDERIIPVVKTGFDGLRAREWLCIVLSIVLLLVLFYVFMSSGDVMKPVAQREKLEPVRVEPDFRYQELLAMSESLIEEHRSSLEEIDRELLTNYALIMKAENLAEFKAEIARGRKIVERSQKSARERFKEFYVRIQDVHAELRLATQRMYGIVMSAIEATSEQLYCDECAIDCLFDNKGKWSVRHGEVIWSDSALAEEFMSYCTDGFAEAKRWERDFGAVELRSKKNQDDHLR
jgi:hypothetical protein